MEIDTTFFFMLGTGVTTAATMTAGIVTYMYRVFLPRREHEVYLRYQTEELREIRLVLQDIRMQGGRLTNEYKRGTIEENEHLRSLQNP